MTVLKGQQDVLTKCDQLCATLHREPSDQSHYCSTMDGLAMVKAELGTHAEALTNLKQTASNTLQLVGMPYHGPPLPLSLSFVAHSLAAIAAPLFQLLSFCLRPRLD